LDQHSTLQNRGLSIVFFFFFTRTVAKTKPKPARLPRDQLVVVVVVVVVVKTSESGFFRPNEQPKANVLRGFKIA
jgi:hypothetical protein